MAQRTGKIIIRQDGSNLTKEITIIQAECVPNWEYNFSNSTENENISWEGGEISFNIISTKTDTNGIGGSNIPVNYTVKNANGLQVLQTKPLRIKVGVNNSNFPVAKNILLEQEESNKTLNISFMQEGKVEHDLFEFDYPNSIQQGVTVKKVVLNFPNTGGSEKISDKIISLDNNAFKGYSIKEGSLGFLSFDNSHVEDNTQVMTLTIPSNSTTNERSHNFTLVQKDSGRQILFEIYQEANTEPVYEFHNNGRTDITLNTSYEIANAIEGEDSYITSTKDGVSHPFTGQILEGEEFVSSSDIEGSDSTLIHVNLFDNLTTTPRIVKLRLTQTDSGKTINYTIIQEANVQCYPTWEYTFNGQLEDVAIANSGEESMIRFFNLNSNKTDTNCNLGTENVGLKIKQDIHSQGVTLSQSDGYYLLNVNKTNDSTTDKTIPITLIQNESNKEFTVSFILSGISDYTFTVNNLTNSSLELPTPNANNNLELESIVSSKIDSISYPSSVFVPYRLEIVEGNSFAVLKQQEILSNINPSISIQENELDISRKVKIKMTQRESNKVIYLTLTQPKALEQDPYPFDADFNCCHSVSLEVSNITPGSSSVNAVDIPIVSKKDGHFQPFKLRSDLSYLVHPLKIDSDELYNGDPDMRHGQYIQTEENNEVYAVANQNMISQDFYGFAVFEQKDTGKLLRVNIIDSKLFNNYRCIKKFNTVFEAKPLQINVKYKETINTNLTINSEESSLENLMVLKGTTSVNSNFTSISSNKYNVKITSNNMSSNPSGTASEYIAILQKDTGRVIPIEVSYKS